MSTYESFNNFVSSNLKSAAERRKKIMMKSKETVNKIT